MERDGLLREAKKGELTEAQQTRLAELNLKDVLSDEKLIKACTSGSADECKTARKDALAKAETYPNLGYQYPKESLVGYQQIQSLLDSTDPKAVFNLLEGYKQAYMTAGYSEEEARKYAGRYVGALYALSGFSAVAVSGSLVKQFGRDVATKPKINVGGTSNSQPTGAMNPATSSKLNNQLAAQEVANGHAFDKHVLQRGEFDALGIRTRAHFQQHVENVINNPTDVRYYSDGRMAYIDATTRTVVIRNPGKSESTAFRPDYGIGWDKYLKRLPEQRTP